METMSCLFAAFRTFLPTGLALAATFLFPPASGNAADLSSGFRTVIFQNGAADYEGAIDVGLQQTDPSASLHNRYVWIDKNSEADDNQALLRFQNIFGPEPHQVPEGAAITRAFLRIHLGTVASGPSPEVTRFHRMQVPWDDTASWDAAFWSGHGIAYDGSDALAEPDGSMTFDTPGRQYDVDVTPSLQAWAAGEQNYGWLIRTDSSNGYAYYTTHAAPKERPALHVEYDTDPGNVAPTARFHEPAGDETHLENPVRLSLTPNDANGDDLSVTLYGREWPVVPEDFTVVVLPDTQYYSAAQRGGERAMFDRQTEWIVENREALNIAFVLHVGDIVQSGDAHANGGENRLEWATAARAMHRLEDPDTTGLPEGIPYTITVGNHDQEPQGDPDGATRLYNDNFGVGHFEEKSYYGGYFGTNNDNHYELFETGPYKFISISLEFNGPTASRNSRELLQWADALLKRYPERRGIVTTHYLMGSGNPGPWSPDGAAIYNALKDNPNLDLMFGGHVRGEGWRTDTFNGNTVQSFLQDYQFYENGGNGYLRIFTFSPRHDEIRVRTYSPWLDAFEDDWNSAFTVPYPMGAPETPAYRELASYDVAAGERVEHAWDGLQAGREYEWYAVIDDGRKQTATDTHLFRTIHPYDAWRDSHFPTGAAEADRLADPDADGFTNVLEFFFGSDPMNAARESRQPTAIAADGGLSIHYTRQTEPQLLWDYEISHDLARWQPLKPGNGQATERVQDNGDGTESVTLEIETDAQPTFWRIRAY